MTLPLKLPCPAKWNRTLRVRERRADGYHNLESEFQFIDLSDELRLYPSDQLTLHVSGSLGSLPPPAGNLVLKAAERLRARLRVPTLGAKIELCKHIPMGSGLGGGSSNAASALLGLHWLWNGDLSIEALISLALELGSDVPLFVRGLAGRLGGRGERWEPKNWPEARVCITWVPEEPCWTRKAFFALARQRAQGQSGPRPPTVRILNDFERLLPQLSPKTQELLNWLRERGEACLSGSGNALVVPCDELSYANRLDADLKAKGWPYRFTRSRNCSPLLKRIQSLKAIRPSHGPTASQAKVL